MSKKKVSAEEKRTRMLQLFYEKKDFFQLKELERIAPKEKGIVSQSVKEVVQSLVDDDLIDTDKIGTSIYFWSFPSKGVATRKRKMEDYTEKIREIDKKTKTTLESIEEAKVGREDTQDRTELLKNLAEAEEEMKQLKAKIELYQENDPDVLKEVEDQTNVAKEAANRWTDNIFAVKSWCKKKFFIEDSVMNKQFGIPDDLDYMD